MTTDADVAAATKKTAISSISAIGTMRSIRNSVRTNVIKALEWPRRRRLLEETEPLFRDLRGRWDRSYAAASNPHPPDTQAHTEWRRAVDFHICETFVEQHFRVAGITKNEG
jgi:hypothetical protein